MEILEKFRPLTFHEVITEKPYRVKFGKYIYETNLLNCVNIVRFFEYKDIILNNMQVCADKKKAESNFTSVSVDLLKGFISLSVLLYDLCKKPKFILNRLLHRRAFLKHCLENTDFLFALADQVMAYNARVLQWNQLPAEICASTGKQLHADGFYEWVKGYDPKKTDWLMVCYAKESEKYAAIVAHQNSKGKHGR